MSVWSPQDEWIVRHLYATTPASQIGELVGRAPRNVAMKARKMGLRRDGNAGCFVKGQEPPNKGMRRPGWAPGRMATTQFRKGERRGVAAELYQPIGTERVSKDGYLERKVNDGLPLQKRWRAVHLLEWEAVNGPLPAGHAVAFRDGNKRNFDLANLELVSRAELMRRNSYHNRYPKEVARLIQLRGALNRKINRREARP